MQLDQQSYMQYVSLYMTFKERCCIRVTFANKWFVTGYYNIILSRPSSGVTYKERVWIEHWIWHFNRLYFLITMQSVALSPIFNYGLYSTIAIHNYSSLHALSPVCLSVCLLSHTSPLVPVSHGGRSPSWILELFQSHRHSDLQCALQLLKLLFL
jgi:hypothetical protein